MLKLFRARSLGRYDSPEDQQKSKIVLSESDYNFLYNDHYCLTNLIQPSILINHTGIFTGMSLTDPNTLRLMRVARKLGVRHWHYVFLRKPEENIEEKAKHFRKLGVDPVWFENFSDLPKLLRNIQA